LTGWIIAGIILALLIAICLLRIGVTARYSEAGLEVWAKLGFYRRKVYPAEEGKKRAEKEKPPKAQKDEEKDREKEEKGGPVELFKKYYDLALNLLKSLKKAVRIDLLRVRFVAAAKDDAAKAAILYGKAWAAEGIILAVLENNIKVLKKEINIVVDYQADKPSIFCHVAVSASVGGLLLVGFRVIKDLLKIKMNEKGGAKNGKANC